MKNSLITHKLSACTSLACCLLDGSDFIGISGQQLTFGPAVSSITVPVDILDNDPLEVMIESFSASLTSDVPRLVLSPDEVTVDIIDNESDSKQLLMPALNIL